jgi:hypothetical protein
LRSIPRGEEGEPERRGLGWVDVAHGGELVHRRVEELTMRAVVVLAEEFVLGRERRARGIVGEDAIGLADGGVHDDAPALPRWVDALAHGFDRAADVAPGDARPGERDAREAAPDPEVHVVQRGGFDGEADLGAARGRRIGPVRDGVDVGGDGASLTADDGGVHRVEG